MPIFDARTWAALEVSEVERDLALTRYEKAVQSAFRDVADALARYGSIEEELEAQQSLVDAARKTYRLSDARYKKGIDIYLIVLDAQRSLYAAEQGLIAANWVEVHQPGQIVCRAGRRRRLKKRSPYILKKQPRIVR